MKVCDHIIGYERSFDGVINWLESEKKEYNLELYLDVWYNYCPLCGEKLDESKGTEREA